MVNDARASSSGGQMAVGVLVVIELGLGN